MKHSPVVTQPTSSHDEAIRKRLLDATIACLEQHGLKKLTMSHIGEHSGLVRQTVYNYYRSKNEILAAAFMREGLRFATRVAAHIQPFEKTEDQFVEGLLFVVEHFPHHPILKQILENGTEFLHRVGMQHYPFADIGLVVFAEVFQRHAYLRSQAEEISEYWSRNAMSLITLRGATQRNRTELEAYVRHRLLPGLHL